MNTNLHALFFERILSKRQWLASRLRCVTLLVAALAMGATTRALSAADTEVGVNPGPLPSVATPTASTPNSPGGNPALISTPNGYPTDADGAEIRLGAAPLEGDLTITGSDASLVLDPGEHLVTGNVTLNAKNNTVIVSFDREKQYGSLKVDGTLNLGPENPPRLAVDLSSIGNLVPGETFAFAFAEEIHGQFSGLGEGTTFEMGDVKLRINYTANSIVITVISAPHPWERHHLSRTPIIELDNSLIDPTSTAPGA